MHFGIATPSVFLVCVWLGWAGLGDVVQYLVSDESAEGFSSSYYIHNGFKSILKQPNVFKPCEFSFSTVVTPKYTSWKSGKIKVWMLQSTKIFSNPLCILLLWLSLSWDFLRLVDGIQFRHTHTASASFRVSYFIKRRQQGFHRMYVQ